MRAVGLKTLAYNMNMDIFDSKRILFTGWNSWLSYTENAVITLLKGVFGVVYAIVVGIVSALYKLLLFLIRKIREWPLFSFMLITIILCIISLVGFVNLTVKSRMYEYQRDSVKYELDCFKHTYGVDTIKINSCGF